MCLQNLRRSYIISGEGIYEGPVNEIFISRVGIKTNVANVIYLTIEFPMREGNMFATILENENAIEI